MREIVIAEYEEAKHREDVLYVAQNMRAIDRLEIAAFGYGDGLTALRASMDNSLVSLVVKGETPLCVLGVSAGREACGRAVWLLATEDIEGYKREFLQYGYLLLSYWFGEFGAMYNYVSVENRKSVRWLEWLGASWSEPFLFGGQEFRQFILDERSF